MTRKARIPAKTKPGDRFSVQQVLAIRLQAQRGHTQAEIARAYRCSEMTIYRLLAGKTYKRVRSDVDAPALPETPRAQSGPSPAATAAVKDALHSIRPAPKPTAPKPTAPLPTPTTTPTKTTPSPAQLVTKPKPQPQPPPAAPPMAWDFNTPQPVPPAPPDPRAPRLIRREKDENGRQVCLRMSGARTRPGRMLSAGLVHFRVSPRYRQDREESAVREHTGGVFGAAHACLCLSRA